MYVYIYICYLYLCVRAYVYVVYISYPRMSVVNVVCVWYMCMCGDCVVYVLCCVCARACACV